MSRSCERPSAFLLHVAFPWSLAHIQKGACVVSITAWWTLQMTISSVIGPIIDKTLTAPQNPLSCPFPWVTTHFFLRTSPIIISHRIDTPSVLNVLKFYFGFNHHLGTSLRNRFHTQIFWWLGLGGVWGLLESLFIELPMWSDAGDPSTIQDKRLLSLGRKWGVTK